ncbi:cation:proton antiporter [Acidipropionibacterium jensenii]|uniref:cation:proton antiporter n=1 Tax=Acidipropionibacterium jensenii TaxID=1749 RepID=UPI002647F01B|nr:cation:proton antiporter [Acidipropionibacterium jensenii]MDN5976409.1 cation:proton antiporter [Acidipropionibacterium jensenii]MDN5996145.1 cation:proton antiporter [Acidipropionibacterium jensenii]MDN6020842.1 cation:proton antiporter [Acidipropionibacterium jensenii]MDN6426250.1 cation:proton antiporter [Acidipropionibacterium jensenii]MDN6479937.1 cation:proton antiporter [Acidipropionibacterium jensenii]
MTVVLVIIIATLFVIAAAELLADRTGIAAPILLLLLGAAVALIPGMPEVEVEPELVLMIILPPLLYSAAVNMPVSDFRRNIAPIGVLAVLLVAISAGVIGFVVNRMAPGIGIAACLALGAIVSPSDAVATSIVRRAGVSRRVVTVLDGEGLINDASALVILASAVGAIASQVSAGKVIGDFLLAVLVALVVGWLIGRLMIWLRSRVHEPTADTVLSLATPFLAYLPAEHLHGSGLVAAVVAGLVASHHGPRVLTPTQRMSSRNTWGAVMLILESAVFLLMGLELTAIVKDMEAESFGWRLAVSVAAVALVLTLVVRTAVVAPLLMWVARRSRRRSRHRTRLVAATERVGQARASEDGTMEFRGTTLSPGRVERFGARLRRMISDLDYYIEHPLGPREGVVMIWAGMRGAITLAAAQTLPLDTPHRSFLVVVAFLVAAASLLLQGSTLGLVVKLARPAVAEGIDPQEQAEIRTLLHRAVRDVPVSPGMRTLLARMNRQEGDQAEDNRLQAAAVALAWRQFAEIREKPTTSPAGDAIASPEHRRRAAEISRNYALRLIVAQRRALLDASDSGQFSPEAVSAALDTLDADQLSLETRGASLD